VNYLLGSDGVALLKKHGLTVQPVKVTGTAAKEPAGLQGVLGGK
jgi:hypothetical protein